MNNPLDIPNAEAKPGPKASEFKLTRILSNKSITVNKFGYTLGTPEQLHKHSNVEPQRDEERVSLRHITIPPTNNKSQVKLVSTLKFI